MKFFIDDEEVTEEELNDKTEELTDDIVDDSYDEMLNEGEEVIIGSLRYDVAHVLQSVDPIAYDVGKSDYSSSLLEDFQYELEQTGILYIGTTKLERKGK